MCITYTYTYEQCDMDHSDGAGPCKGHFRTTSYTVIIKLEQSYFHSCRCADSKSPSGLSSRLLLHSEVTQFLNCADMCPKLCFLQLLVKREVRQIFTQKRCCGQREYSKAKHCYGDCIYMLVDGQSILNIEICIHTIQVQAPCLVLYR